MRYLSRITTSLKKLLTRNKYIDRYIKSSEFRITLSLLLNMMSNILYVIFNAIYGIIHGSLWFASVAVYYVLLASVSYTVLKLNLSEKTVDKEEERRTCIRCGALLIVFDFPMTVIMIYSAIGSVPPLRSIVFIAELAIYSLFAVIRAVKGIVHSKGAGFKLRTAYTVRLVYALISIFNLRLSVSDSDTIAERINLLLALLVSATVFLLAVLLIRSINKSR